MSLTPGTRLGAYEIVGPLGAGGMGEVYRARDTRLGRDVAIKVLSDAFTTDPERLARFEREAKLLASMNHGGIAAIFGLEDAGGHPAFVMEVVEGVTLAERLAGGPLGEDEALGVARQLAEALEYAHDRGIVHRDLKPANIKLRPDGVIKVLDFGLARALEVDTARGSSDLTQSPTITNRMTAAGVILGTAAYMAPEQARGRDADRRADIWAFGAVLFEMLSGKRAFEGETVSDTLAAVMRDEPDWSALPAGLSPRWRRLLGRCLAKDPRARLQAIGEARIALSEAAEEPIGVAAGGEAAPARLGRAWAVRRAAFGALFGVLLGAAGVLLFRPSATRPGATEVSMMLPFGQRFGADVGYSFFAISPDGRAMAYASRSGSGSKMHVRRLDRREDIELPGTENARSMFFSPDGEWIGFFNSQTLSKVSVHGGSPVVLAPAGQDRGGTWLDDGTIVFSSDTTVPLTRIPATGGTPVAVTTLDATRHERTHRFPCALAGGPWVVFTVGRTDSPGGYDDSPIDAVNVKTGERRQLVKGARRAVWAPPGYLVFHRSGDLYAMRLNPRNPRPGPEPLPVQDGVGGEASSGAAFFEFSKDGTLAWMRAETGGDQRDIGWLDRDGHWTPTKLPPGPYLTVSLSPDGTRVLVCAGAGGGSSDLWVGDLANGAMNRLTYGNSADPGLWLPDGRSMVYPRFDSTGTAVVVRRLDDVGGERVLYRATLPLFVSSLTPDGRKVIICDYGKAEGRMRTANLDGDPDVHELPVDAGNQRNEQAGMVSPDGRWLAYISNRTQREEVYVRSFDGTGGRWQISTGGGGGVRWGRDSRELFFVENGAERLMRVSLEARGTELVVGQPEPLFEAPPSPMEPTYRDQDYDRLRDRFLFTRPPSGANERREIALSLGWTSGLASKLRAEKGAK
jgi:eukaryotic-like serine/threonine-protein kinase